MDTENCLTSDNVRLIEDLLPENATYIRNKLRAIRENCMGETSRTAIYLAPTTVED